MSTDSPTVEGAGAGTGTGRRDAGSDLDGCGCWFIGEDWMCMTLGDVDVESSASSVTSVADPGG